jgi:arginyl-tRNA synthetase
VNIFGDIKEEIKGLMGYSDDFSVEQPANLAFGDVSINAAMVLSKKLGKNPRMLAEEIVNKLPYKAEIAGAGFINITLNFERYIELVQAIDKDYGKGLPKEKVNIEFVSANPTGPMHLGHARGAIIGDSLARLLTFYGYEVVREYYINDAGSQVDTLTKSAYTRYLQAKGEAAEIKEGQYPGEYLIPVGKALYEKFGDTLSPEQTKAFTLAAMLDLIRADLARLNVHHDVFISEASLDVNAAIDFLAENNLSYRGTLEPPKGKVIEDFETQEQLIFRSKDFGDDCDRPVVKSNGQATYFAGDIAYHKNKIDRGFNKMIISLGADHGGYIARLKAIVTALSGGKAEIEVIIHQLIKFVKDGEPLKMSKRSGNFLTVEDVLDEVDASILRFVILSRKPSEVIEFDFDKVIAQSKDNPVFYVQYAAARASSIVAKYSGNAAPDLASLEVYRELIQSIALFPRIVEQAAKSHEPHRIAYYLGQLASVFHNTYANCPAFLSNDGAKSSAAVVMLKGFLQTMENGLGILGVKSLNKM